MSKARKIFLRGACATGGLFVLACAAALFLSYLFNTGVIGKNFQAAIEARYHIRATQIRIGFRPLPVVVLRGVKAAIPGTLDASIGTVYLHLDVLPLFSGKLTLAKIELVSPVISVRMPARPAQGTLSQRLDGLVKNIFGPLAALAPATLLARQGSLKLIDASDRSFFIKHIDFKSTAGHGGVAFKLTSGESSFWQTLEFKGLVAPAALTGSGVLSVTGGNPQNLQSCLDGSSSGHLGGSLADFTAALFYTGPGKFRADFTASVPSFVFGLGDPSLTIKDGFLAGLFITDPKGLELTVSDFRFHSPHLDLTASCAQKYSDGIIRLKIEGRRTDAAEMRSLLLAVDKKTKPINHFFKILREAQVPKILFTSHASKVSDLLKLKNMTLKCKIEKGVILAPKADLLVSNVSGDMRIKDGVLTATRLSGQTPGSTTRDGTLTLGLPHDNPLFHLDLPIEADLSELPAVLNNLSKNSAFKQELAQISDVTGKTRGRLVIGDRLGALAVTVRTDRFNLSCSYGRLGGPVSLEGASFTMDGDKIGLSDVDAKLSDSTLSVSGSVKDLFGRHTETDLQLKGRLGPAGSKIAASFAGLPNWVKPISGMDLLTSSLTWEKGTKAAFNGKMQLSSGPSIEADVVDTPGELSIRRLAIKDKDSDAQLSVHSLPGGFRIGFSGTLGSKTLASLLVGKSPFKGPIGGKFEADLYPDNPQKSNALGEITLTNFRLPGFLPSSVSVAKAEIEARGKKLDIKSAAADWQGSRLNVTGDVDLSGADYLVNLNASTNSLDLDRILKSQCMIPKTVEKRGRKNPWHKPVRGVLRIKSKSISYEGEVWAPARGEVLLNKGPIHIRLARASVCGIPASGNIVLAPGNTDISLDLSARNQDLQTTLACLFKNRPLVSGNYELTSHIEAKTPCAADEVLRNSRNNDPKPQTSSVSGSGPTALSRSLEGKVEFQARNGRILRFDTFTKIVSVLSLSEIYRGVVPDLLDKGCPYKTLEVKGKIKNGVLVLSDSFLDGPSIKMVFSGQIDLVRRKINVIALVAPQRTVERVVNATPVVGKVLKDAFVTVPVHISGNLADPSVVLLSPGAVGHELLGVMQRLVKLPLTLLQPKKW